MNAPAVERVAVVATGVIGASWGHLLSRARSRRGRNRSRPGRRGCAARDDRVAVGGAAGRGSRARRVTQPAALHDLT